MTIPYCIDYCIGKGFQFAGLQAGKHCSCSNQYSRYGVSNTCSTPCQGNILETCGNDWTNQVYRAAEPTGRVKNTLLKFIFFVKNRNFGQKSKVGETFLIKNQNFDQKS